MEMSSPLLRFRLAALGEADLVAERAPGSSPLKSRGRSSGVKRLDWRLRSRFFSDFLAYLGVGAFLGARVEVVAVVVVVASSSSTTTTFSALLPPIGQSPSWRAGISVGQEDETAYAGNTGEED